MELRQASWRRSLIILHIPGLQDRRDFEAVRDILARTHPDIRLVIVSTPLDRRQLRALESNETGVLKLALTDDLSAPPWPELSSRPALIFSPMPVAIPEALRGYRLFARHVSKLEEMARLNRAGFAVPRSAALDVSFIPDEAVWGPMVIVKPIDGRGGGSVRLLRTRNVPEVLARQRAETGSSSRRLMVQAWVDTGPYVISYRAMTVLDTVAYVCQSIAVDPEPVTVEGLGREGLPIASNARRRRIVQSDERDVYELASGIARRLPFSTTFGIDIIRDHATGKLFVLELNSGFPTWHLSSRAAKKHERELGTFSLAERYKQYNSLENIADALARATERFAL